MRISDWSSDVCCSDLQPPRNAKPARRVEQIVRSVIAQRAGQRADEISPPPRRAGREDHVALVSRNQLGADRPGPRLLIEDRALPLERARQDRKSTRLNSSH